MAANASRPGAGGPLVSVLICSYNAEKFIEATIRSVIGQTYGNLEILVLDNGSMDGTAGVLKRLGSNEPRLRLYAERENRGPYGGLNYLLERAEGDYIAIQDHDDLWRPDKVLRQVEFLEKNGAYAGCGTAIVNYYERYDTFLLRRQPEISRVAWHTSLVFRRSDLRYNAAAKVANDFHFMKQMLCGDGRRIYNFSGPYVLRTIRADHSNLSTRWINLRNLKDILSVRIGAVDRLALLMRLTLPERIADYLVLKICFRKNVLSRANVEISFSLKRGKN